AGQMTQLQERIAQFRKMAHDDPENELGHFRLGQLLMDDMQYDEAIQSFRRTVELSPQFSKVYQLLGACYIKLNRRDEAVKALKEGAAVAEGRGDNRPGEEMAKLLVRRGEPAPPPRAKLTGGAAAGSGFHCHRPGCEAGRFARQLPKPPMSDDLGK